MERARKIMLRKITFGAVVLLGGRARPNAPAYLIKYLINWVAGTKIIFITLLIIIIICGDPSLQLYSIIALIISISTFYWRLYPLIKTMDRDNQISPKGYSKTLARMIASFLIIFLSVVVYYFFFQQNI